MSTARATTLALCATLAAAAALTIASLPRHAGEAATTTAGFPWPAVKVDRRLKGDRLDRVNLPSALMPDEPLSPGNVVPKTSPATPIDPQGAIVELYAARARYANHPARAA